MNNPNENGFVGHDKPVKSILKTATSIIAAVDRFMTAEAWCILALCDVAAIGFLVRLGGI